MACRLFDTKPLFKSVLIYCHLDPWEQTSVKFYWTYYNFLSRKVFNNVVCKMVAFLFRQQWVNMTQCCRNCVSSCKHVHCGRLACWPGPLFTKKTPSYGYMDPHYKTETVWRPSQVYDGNPYTDKTASSQWIETPVSVLVSVPLMSPWCQSTGRLSHQWKTQLWFR